MVIKHDGWTLIDHDPRSGATLWAIFDGLKTHYRRDVPVENLLKLNHEQAAATQRGWKGDHHMIAMVPPAVVEAAGLKEALRQDDQKYIAKWMNDGDNARWRTKDGRI